MDRYLRSDSEIINSNLNCCSDRIWWRHLARSSIRFGYRKFWWFATRFQSVQEFARDNWVMAGDPMDSSIIVQPLRNAIVPRLYLANVKIRYKYVMRLRSWREQYHCTYCSINFRKFICLFSFSLSIWDIRGEIKYKHFFGWSENKYEDYS